MASWYETITAPFKTMSEMTAQFVEVRDTIKFGEIKTKLQAEIMASYDAAFAIKEREAALSSENEQLKRRISELEAAHAKLENYEAKTLPPGVYVYTPKPGTEEAKHPHYACATCYQRGKISRLHASEIHRGQQRLTCSECTREVLTGNYIQPAPVQVTRYNPLRRV